MKSFGAIVIDSDQRNRCHVGPFGAHECHCPGNREAASSHRLLREVGEALDGGSRGGSDRRMGKKSSRREPPPTADAGQKP